MRLKLLLLTLMLLLSVPASKVNAASCSNVEDYGSVSLKLPVLPKKGAYNLWLRLQAARSDSKVLIEINGRECIELGLKDQALQQWLWLNQTTDSKSAVYNFDQTEGNSLKLYGLTPGIKVDRLILVNGECTPQDEGDNCQPGADVNIGSQSGLTEELGLVSGLIYPSQAVVKRQSEIKQIAYYRGNQKLQAGNAAIKLDTTLLPNGENTVMTKVVFMDGSELSETTKMEVNNPESTFSPLWRWLRINKTAVWSVIIAVGSLLVLALGAFALKRLMARKRLMDFHGF